LIGDDITAPIFSSVLLGSGTAPALFGIASLITVSSISKAGIDRR
jgi:hypothetical protein